MVHGLPSKYHPMVKTSPSLNQALRRAATHPRLSPDPFLSDPTHTQIYAQISKPEWLSGRIYSLSINPIAALVKGSKYERSSVQKESCAVSDKTIAIHH